MADIENAADAATLEPDTAAALREAKEKATQTRKVAHDFLVGQGLYATLDVSTELGSSVLSAIRSNSAFGFDAYCVGCKRETTFRVAPREVAKRGIGGPYATHATPVTLFAVNAVCQRDFKVYTYVFLVEDNTLTKIGQAPSVADIAFGELRTIDRALERTDRQELGKALGLFAHDSALGAFVYLRRVFERMVDRAHERQASAGHPVEGFSSLRMDEKVAALKDELPELVVRNSAVFSVLSLGLHELTEEQCAKHFPVIKAVLFQMLEQEEHKRKAAMTQRETEAALQRILSDPTGEGAATG
jgi:hypothetical protein